MRVSSVTGKIDFFILVLALGSSTILILGERSIDRAVTQIRILLVLRYRPPLQKSTVSIIMRKKRSRSAVQSLF